MSMIRVLFCTLLAAWAVLPLRADDRGRALVRSLSAKIASYASYEVLFTADMDGEFDGVQGRIVVSGDRYRVEVNGSELYCDGKLLYTFRADEDEVTIERPTRATARCCRIPLAFSASRATISRWLTKAGKMPEGVVSTGWN